MSNTKNYTEQGGDVTHIGGKLIIDEGGSIEGLDTGGEYILPVASNDALGGVKAKAKDAESVEVAVDETGKLYVPAYPKVTKLDKQEDSVATDVETLKTDFNALLSKLKTAGLMGSE